MHNTIPAHVVFWEVRMEECKKNIVWGGIKRNRKSIESWRGRITLKFSVVRHPAS